MTTLFLRCRVHCLLLLLLCMMPAAASAQLEFLRSLFGGRQAPPEFRGMAELYQARNEALQGNVEKSISLARQVLQMPFAVEPLGDAVSQTVALRLIELSRLWLELDAPADLVADTLLDVVLPPKQAGTVFPLTLPWQQQLEPWVIARPSGRLSRPDSVSAELAAWAVRAKQTEKVWERLTPCLESDKHKGIAAIVAVQLAVAEQDADAARPHLHTLRELIAKPQSFAMSELVFHAIAPALDEPTQEDGLALLESVIDGFNKESPPMESGLNSGSSWLRIIAARLHARAGRNQDARRLVESAMARPFNDQRYGADYAAYLGRLQRMQAAAVLLDAGLVPNALELLAPLGEQSELRAFMNYDHLNIPVMLGRELQKLPAIARYELLRKWVLPPDQPRIRDLTDFVTWEVPAAASAENDAVELPRMGLLRDIYSAAWHLLMTARELGGLDDLIRQLEAAPVPSLQAESLRTLAHLLRDQSKSPPGAQARPTQTLARLQQLLQLTTQNVPQQNDPNKAPFPMLTFVVATEAAQYPEYRSVAQTLMEKLIEHTQRLQWDRPRAHVRMAWAEVVRLRAAEDSHRGPSGQLSSQEQNSHEQARGLLPGDVLGSFWPKLHPKLWIESGIESAARHADGSLPGVWVAHDEYVQHLTGAYDSDLVFAVPLTGKFQVTLESREGGWSEGCSGYGGALFAPFGYSSQAPLRGEGRHGYLAGPRLETVLHRGPWNQHTIEVDEGVVRYLANGQLIHEDAPGVSAPWFCLSADWGRTPSFRNMRITGTPVIPNEVPLLADVKLRGWVSSHYEESRPDPLEPLPGGPDAVFIQDPLTDWTFRNGELRASRREAFLPGTIESRLYYYRPLRPRESVQYEFFYRSGSVEAHPTIGRLAFVLDSRGITRHWLTDSQFDVLGLPPDNGVRTAKALPLKDNDWNTAEIQMLDGSFEIRLNNELVLQQALDPTESRTFGIYHDASRTSSRVRNAILRGGWQREFGAELKSAFESPQPTDPPTNSGFVTQLMGEQFFSDNAYAIYRRALSLDPQQRYDFLYHWVMPGPTHDFLRMAGAFTPTHPAPPVLRDNPIDAATFETRLANDQRLVQTGGNFVCPAILLALSAAELNRLEALRNAVLEIDAPNNPALQRATMAMLGIIGLLQNHPEETLTALWECNRLILEPATQEQHIRWSEPALCSLAIQHPVTREAAYELLDRIQRRQLQSGKPGNTDFGRFVRQLHGQVHHLLYGGNFAEFGTAPKLTQWKPVSQPTARSRGIGVPIAHFDAMTGELALRGGHDLDMVYFQSPLRGNYEVRCKLTHFDYCEALLMASGIANALKYTHKEAKLHHARLQLPDVPTPAEVTPRVRTWLDYRVVVQDGHYTSFVNGQKLYEADLPEQPDPWLAVMGWAGGSQRAARNIVISGAPEIPDELDLLAPPDLRGWMVDYYSDAIGQTTYPWRLQNGELACQQTIVRGATPGRLKLENIIRYHRPMLEDGQIAYEFYYDPETKVPVPQDPSRNYGFPNQQVQYLTGRSIVHPALDRLVCLLEQDGVQIHWLTDGRHDRTGLRPDNVTVVPRAEVQKLPLKERDWNAVQLAVSGDVMTITLNGQQVASLPIDPSNSRHFGLFHYVNESDVRVRNVRYRGNWPKTLPAIQEQELATGPERFAVIPEGELPDRWSYDFTRSRFDPAMFVYHWNRQVAAQFIRPTDDGLRMSFPANMPKPATVAGVHPNLRIVGDFIATLEYTGLTTSQPKESFGCGLSFKVSLDRSYETGLEIRNWVNTSVTTAMWQFKSPLNQYVYYNESVSEFPRSGRARLVRRGPIIYYFIAPAGSDEFRLVTQRPVGANDAKTLNIQIDCGDAAGGVDVIVKNVTVEASKIVPVK